MYSEGTFPSRSSSRRPCPGSECARRTREQRLGSTTSCVCAGTICRAPCRERCAASSWRADLLSLQKLAHSFPNTSAGPTEGHSACHRRASDGEGQGARRVAWMGLDVPRDGGPPQERGHLRWPDHDLATGEGLGCRRVCCRGSSLAGDTTAATLTTTAPRKRRRGSTLVGGVSASTPSPSSLTVTASVPQTARRPS